MLELIALLIPLAIQQAPAKDPKGSKEPAAKAPLDLRPAFGADNAAFARGLYKEGFEELASDFCDAFGKWDGADSDEKAAVRSVYLDMRLELARQESDLVKRKDEMAQILKEKEAFIAQFPDSAEAKEAELAMPDAYRMLGEALVSVMDKESDPEQLKALREEGSNAFAHVQEVLRKQKKAVEDQLGDATLTEEQTDSLRDRRAAAWFNLVRTDYFRALLFGKEDPERARRMKVALQGFQDFALEFDDKLLAYHGYIFQGLCDKDLGQTDQALTDFDEAIALREKFDVGEDGRYKAETAIDDVISWAVLQKATMLADLGRNSDALELTKEFFAKSPAPEKAQFGLPILALQADCEIKAGDTKTAGATAQRLQELDPNGPWGARGREVSAKLLGGGDGSSGARKMGSSQLLKIAETLIGKGDADGAVSACVRALDAAGADADASVDALVMMGAIYGKQNDYLGAAVCFDTAWMVYPKAAKAADALYRAYNCYMQINTTEKRPFYAREIETRRLKLANDYPTSPHAAKLQLSTGTQLESDQKFVEAADFYLKVQQGNSNYEDAQFKAARCLVKETQRLIKAKQTTAVRPTAARADEQLKKALGILDDASAKMLDLTQKQIWEAQAFECRTLLANLYMFDGVGRAADVPKALEGVEDRFADDPDKIALAWSLRIQALNSLGRFGDAEKLLEALLQKGGGAHSAAIAAGVFARSCDSRALELLEKDPKSAEGEDAWKKAFRFYVISLKPKLKDPAAARSGELESVGNRCIVIGKHMNGIPDSAKSFLTVPTLKTPAPEYFEEAAKLYEASLEFVPSYITRISLARALGFLGRFDEAGAQYAALFEQERLVDVAKGEVVKEVAQQRPQLLAAYLEWGVVELKAGLSGDRNVDRLARANAVFDLIVKFTKTTARERTETWWNARYWQIRAWVDEGEYKNADIALRELERTTEASDQEKYGLSEQFKKLKSELAGKVFDNGPN